jgi:hypothetical protein
VRIRLFLVMSVAIAAVVVTTVLVYDQLDQQSGGGDQVVSGPEEQDPTRPGDPVVLGPGQVEVHGSVTFLLIADAVPVPRELPTPLTITSERGFGNGGELTTVRVEGKPSTIVWDGGRPFTLSSGGALRLDPVALALVPAGLQAVLGQGNHALTPGTYRLDTPVAVGQEGIATPSDGVTFEAIEGSLFEARGDASVLFGPDAPHRFVGPGRILLGGTLQVVDADGTRTEDSLQGDPAAFDLTFTPDGAGGWTVDGVIDHAVFP